MRKQTYAISKIITSQDLVQGEIRRDYIVGQEGLVGEGFTYLGPCFQGISSEGKLL